MDINIDEINKTLQEIKEWQENNKFNSSPNINDLNEDETIYKNLLTKLFGFSLTENLHKWTLISIITLGGAGKYLCSYNNLNFWVTNNGCFNC